MHMSCEVRELLLKCLYFQYFFTLTDFDIVRKKCDKKKLFKESYNIQVRPNSAKLQQLSNQHHLLALTQIQSLRTFLLSLSDVALVKGVCIYIYNT